MSGFFYEDEEGLEAGQSSLDQLADTQQRMGEILEFMPVGLFIHKDQTVVFANKEMANMLGVDQQALIGRHLFDFVDDRRGMELLNEFQQLFIKEDAIRLNDVEIKGANGKRRVVRVSASRLPWEGLPVAQVLLLDITELKQKEQELYEISITDPLTGCFNRGFFVEIGQSMVSRGQDQEGNLAVGLIDLDHFKPINDTYGHAAGDKVLIETVRICKAVLLEHYAKENELGAVYRLGGEEFAILLPNRNQTAAEEICQQIRQEIEKACTIHAAQEIKITASIGFATSQSGDEIDTLLARADCALYHAKEEGRNKVVLGYDGMALPPRNHRNSRATEK